MDEAAFHPLEACDVAQLAPLLAAQDAAYLARFQPFSFDAETIRAKLRDAREDRYWALRWSGKLAGFFMLRGFDEGYQRPAFGVFVAQEFAGRGLGQLALAESIRWAKAKGCPSIMLKVSPENARAKDLYERAGFAPIGTCPQSGQLIMEIRLQ